MIIMQHFFFKFDKSILSKITMAIVLSFKLIINRLINAFFNITCIYYGFSNFKFIYKLINLL